MPVVLTVKYGVSVIISPISPDPEISDIPDGADPINVPLVCVIAPDPSALKVTAEPPAPAPKAIPPSLAVVVSDSAPVAVSDDVVVMLLSFDTDRLPNVAPPDATLSAYPEFKIVTLPVVFTVRLGVAVSTRPIVPEPELSDIDVVPVKTPPAGTIPPDP